MLCVAFAAACGGERADPTSRSNAQRPPAAAKPTRPPAPPVDLGLADGYEMRHPIHDGRLTLIPIVAVASHATPEYLTLHDGLNRHLVSVRELGDFRVDTVRLKNKSAQPLFVMAGELIVDGHQDRVMAEDRVIPPHTSLEVHVRCVEQNREGGSRDFHAGNALAELDLLDNVLHKTQTQVWSQVEAINARLGLAPPTKTYRLAAQAQPAARRIALAAQLAQVPDRERMVGLAVAIDGKLVALERFTSPGLYQQLEQEMLGAYVSSDSGPPHEGRALLPADVRAFVAKPEGVVTTEASTIAVLPMTEGPT